MKIPWLLLFLLTLKLSAFAQKSDPADKGIITVDTHGDILFNQIKSGIDIGKLQKTGYFDLVRAKHGHLNGQFFSVWSDETGNFEVANQQIDSLYSLIKRYPNRIALVKTGAELENAVKNGKLAALIGVEGGHMIDDDLNNIDYLAKRGMSYLTLTWNNSTAWASSAKDESSGKIKPENAGLSNFGKKVVGRLNQLGVLVDLSHVGEKTFYDAIAVSTKPIIVSHSCAYTLNPVARNLKDDQIKAVAKNGGVICVNFYSGFLDSAYNKKQQLFFKKYDTELKKLTAKYGKSDATDSLLAKHKNEADALRPALAVLINHINYMVKLAGIDHVGVGADFDGAESFPQGLNSVADYPKLPAALIKQGYSLVEVKKIMGGNVVRLLKENKGR